MKTIILMLVLTIVQGLAVEVSASEKDSPDAIFDRILNRYVSEDGLVDYKGLKKDNEIKKYIEYLSDTDPRSLPSDKHRMAFWINVYNAFVIKGVLEEYPIKSVRDVGWLPDSFFKRKKFEIKLGEITLQVLENEKLREAFREPRIHFAINCASMSCPKLLTEAYKAEKLEEQLEAQAVSFINDRSRNYLDRENSVLYLSHIFKWYRGDFLKRAERIEDYVAGYLNPVDAEFVRNNTTTVKYLDYDWNLNEQK
ncbi:MAG: DUF547 domain-containing protein [Candidatus Scalindua rubra]|uniref:DUF547 domain-containing protein n=1 Tax=Candidatus Scalindua brodae TaxID=237368 RepID=A0A0B0EMP4_9BACT|nr:MAG: hypothetical protein SCABRO_01823 [Candidatus Scalindua brodae]MBZ0107579.1 DUF547 domain-containing protein [Candidatus Scalindua rubra]TWU34788.1 hypothetical protein S225a_11460 [Candidatus Brocadiaceae bacterium S225]